MRILCLIFLFGLSALPAAAASERFDIQGPAGSGMFGETIKVLPNGNIVVVDKGADAPLSDAGAVYLYNGVTRELISRLHGTVYFDQAGSGGVNVLPSGDFIVRSPEWQNKRGAVTFCSKTTGCSGPISAENSMLGSASNDFLGSVDPLVLSNGSYVVRTGGYVSRGSVRLCTGTQACVGPMTTENGLIGERPNDQIGFDGVKPLSNGGYVVISSDWYDNRGAVTFCNGETGCRGLVSSGNSLVGSTQGDRVGAAWEYMGTSVKEVGDGNYLVESNRWNNSGVDRCGAVTWLDGDNPRGVVSPANSFVGTLQFTTMRTTVLKNGNYVIISSINNSTNNTSGGATFGNGNTGVFGSLSSTNSLVGTGTNNDFYTASVHPLENGNYIVNTPTWREYPIIGAATFCNGITGCTGQISESRSLIGVDNYGYTDPIYALPNGNYVVRSSGWATFARGDVGISGRITPENSLMSTGYGGLGFRIVVLPNSNYYVLDSSWMPPTGGNSTGAATFGSGETGVTGITSAANSLVNDHSGAVGEWYWKMLPSGDLLLKNSRWRDYRGSLTLLSSTTPTTGVISASNSLVGTNQYDYVGDAVNTLENGNYVVTAHNWGGIRGAVRVCRSTMPCVGEISESNSLVGTNPNDRIGGGNNLTGIIPVGPHHFVVSSPNWNGDRGAATLIDSRNPAVGHVGSGNSLTGVFALDLLSNGHRELAIPIEGTIRNEDGTFIIFSPKVDSLEKADAGAVTIGSIHGPLTGGINATNSVIGGASDVGNALKFEYDEVNKQLVVGRWLSNAVTIFRPSLPAAPAPVRISGTVRTPAGAPLRNTVVTLSGPSGVVARATTSSFGLFSFDDVLTQQDYTITVGSKRYRFTPRTVTQLTADLNVGDIVGLE